MSRAFAAFCLIGAGLSWAISFNQVNYLPVGASCRDYAAYSFYDSNHDSAIDLHFEVFITPWRSAIYFFTYRPWNRLVLVDSLCWPDGSPSIYPFQVGDFDEDGLADMVVNKCCTLAIFESSAPDSFPKHIVWRLPPVLGGGFYYVGDLDQDGRKDIFYSDRDVFYVVENYGNNAYQLVFFDSMYVIGFGTHMRTADFDGDGWQEVVMGYSPRPSVVLYECTGDNQYRETWTDTVTYVNSYDVFSTDDADEDGKPEFMVNWMVYGGIAFTYGFRIYESVGDDQYEKIFSDTVARIPGDRGYSSSGDVDGDGADEIVWGVGNNWFIYKAVGNNQFARVYTAYPLSIGNGHMSTNMYVYDMNGNGYPEIYETGEIASPQVKSETKVWEIEGVRLHRPNGGEVLTPGSQFPITWEKFTPPGADSFALFVSFNNGLNYSTIATPQHSNDTLFLWSVPETVSDSCKVMIWAYGPPRAGQDTPRGTAWDFSDTVFAIRQVGIKEEVSRQKLEVTLRILQNPALSKNLRIQYSVPKTSKVRLAIYNTLGQEILRVVDDNIQSGLYEEVLTHHLKGGIYFITLTIDDKMISKKVIVIE